MTTPDSFLDAGKPVFGTLIALLRDGVPVLGVIDQPITKERWLGVQGRPTTLNGERLLLLELCVPAVSLAFILEI